jgi:hypothetical protein
MAGSAAVEESEDESSMSKTSKAAWQLLFLICAIGLSIGAANQIRAHNFGQAFSAAVIAGGCLFCFWHAGKV